jgi:hypothetical protein
MKEKKSKRDYCKDTIVVNYRCEKNLMQRPLQLSRKFANGNYLVIATAIDDKNFRC